MCEIYMMKTTKQCDENTKEEQNKWRGISYSYIERLNIVKIWVLQYSQYFITAMNGVQSLKLVSHYLVYL